MRKAVLLVAAGLLLAGCSSSPGPSATAGQGSARLEGYLAKVLAIRTGGLTFTKDPTGTTDDPSACDRFDNGRPTGQVEAQVRYIAKTQPTTDIAAFLDAATKAWNGLAVTRSTNKISASDTSDYQVSVTYYPAVHEMDLVGVSPCLWVNGTPSQ